MSPKFADRPLIAALVRLSIALSACITMPTVVAAQSQDASPVAAVQTVGSEFLFPPPPVGLGMSRLPAVAMRVQRVEIAPAEQRAEQPPPSKRVAPSERETAPAARGEEAPEQASEQPIDAADKPPLAEQLPDATVARTTELVDELLAPLAVQVERNRTDYALLSARIDAIDRQIERELAEKDVFRQGILATVSELASTSDDRDDRFFDEAGFRYRTRDGRYALVIRGEVQADSRVFTRADQDPVNNGFYLPRSRIYFNGWVTKPIEYQFSIQRGFNNLNVLNAYVRFGYSEQLRLTAGRFKTPFTYDFYTYKNWQLLSPERSLFNVNFALNRNVGLMASGRYCQDRLEYAVGIFDGPRNSFSDTNSAKDAIAFLNFKPWVGTNGENFNLGGSVAYGRQDNPLNPVVLRTSTNASMSGLDGDDPVNRANVPFLAFNDGVREFGARNLWEVHTSLYFGPLTVLAAWDSGYSGYAAAGQDTVSLPLDGYHVQVGYMLTGETTRGPTEVRPARPFDARDAGDSIGAWQLVARYSELTLGEEVFTEGLADPDLWTRRVQMVDVGVNWYLNRFVKVTFDWEHARFATPVAYNRTPDLQSTSDLFWTRLSLIF